MTNFEYYCCIYKLILAFLKNQINNIYKDSYFMYTIIFLFNELLVLSPNLDHLSFCKLKVSILFTKAFYLNLYFLMLTF
jgi:hypothetical protein